MKKNVQTQKNELAAALDNYATAHSTLSELWQNSPFSSFQENYPFDHSFDELLQDVSLWVDTSKKSICEYHSLVFSDFTISNIETAKFESVECYDEKEIKQVLLADKGEEGVYFLFITDNQRGVFRFDDGCEVHYTNDLSYALQLLNKFKHVNDFRPFPASQVHSDLTKQAFDICLKRIMNGDEPIDALAWLKKQITSINS